jgi:hypothetical protein
MFSISAIVQVLGDPTKNNNFEVCQQFLKTVHAAKKSNGIVCQRERTVKKVGSHQERRKGKGKGKGKDRHGSASNTKKTISDKDIHVGQYSAEEYCSLTSDQKTLIREMRLEGKGISGRQSCMGQAHR